MCTGQMSFHKRLAFLFLVIRVRTNTIMGKELPWNCFLYAFVCSTCMRVAHVSMHAFARLFGLYSFTWMHTQGKILFSFLFWVSAPGSCVCGRGGHTQHRLGRSIHGVEVMPLILLVRRLLNVSWRFFLINFHSHSPTP